MNGRRIFLLAAALLGVTLAGPVRAEATARAASDVERAEQLFRKGTEAFEAARYSEAYGALRTAWDLTPSYRNAAGLGQVELHLTQFRDAAEHLNYCLRNYPVGGDENARKHVEEGLAEAREHVAALRVRVDPEGAEVVVDGRAAGRAPLEGLVFVEPGSHVVEASAQGRTPAKETVDAPVRSTRDVSLVLGANAAPLPSDVPTPPTPASAPDAARTGSGDSPPGLSDTVWTVIIGGTLTAVAAGTAVVFDVKGASANHDVDDLRGSIGALGSGNCAAPSNGQAPVCARLRDSADERNRDNQIALIAGVSAGVLGAATAVTAIFLETNHASSKKTAKGKGMFMGIGATPGGAAFTLRGAL